MAVIRVTGHIGSGKSTLCFELAQELDYEYHYTGGIIRVLAAEAGLSIEEFYKQLEENPAKEKEIDSRQEDLMVKKDNLVIEGRMAPFLGCAFPTVNIFLKVRREEGAKRLQNRPENKGKTIEEIMRLTEEREKMEKNRYRGLYGLDNHLDENDPIFHIIIDTTHMTAKEVLDYAKEWIPRLLDIN